MKDKENSLNFLDKTTCETVMEDMQYCIDDWSRRDLDTRAAVVTLTRFAVDLAFKYSHTPHDAMQLLTTVVYDNLESFESDELARLLSHSNVQKTTVH